MVSDCTLGRRTLLRSSVLPLSMLLVGCTGTGTGDDGSGGGQTPSATGTETRTRTSTSASTSTNTNTGTGTAAGTRTGTATATSGDTGEGSNTIVLGGETSGWTGQSPADISGTVNPTLVLQPGATHVLVWTNLDGKNHDLVVADANGTKLRATGSSSGRGATRSVTLRATPKMSQYYCSYHRQSMRGALRASEGTETTTSTP